LRRLFSSFARGVPGAGLLLMRTVAAATSIADGLRGVLGAPRVEFLILDALAILAGALVLAGLWTPISGSVVGVLAVWRAFGHSDPTACLLLATIGASLALLGPGAWSADARLFGWKRIEIPDRKS
jgi:putative oxidoreductase